MVGTGGRRTKEEKKAGDRKAEAVGRNRAEKNAEKAEKHEKKKTARRRYVKYFLQNLKPSA